MKRSVIETVLGAVVLVLAGFFLVFSYKTANVKKVSGYDITAAFSGIGGLAVGDDVRISGVRVGSVNNLALDHQDYRAVVTMSIDPSVKLPEDTTAIISSDSLLGGRYMELQPGASDAMLNAGGKIIYTQAPQNLEQLLGKFIFNVSGKKDGQAPVTGTPSTEAVAPAPPPAAEATPPAKDEAAKPEEPASTPAPEVAKPEVKSDIKLEETDKAAPAKPEAEKTAPEKTEAAPAETTPSPAPTPAQAETAPASETPTPLAAQPDAAAIPAPASSPTPAPSGTPAPTPAPDHP